MNWTKSRYTEIRTSRLFPTLATAKATAKATATLATEYLFGILHLQPNRFFFEL